MRRLVCAVLVAAALACDVEPELRSAEAIYLRAHSVARRCCWAGSFQTS